MREPEPTAELRVEGLEKRIGSFELSADFAIARGERVALVGASGCGKTTLLRLIAGLESPDAGKIRIESEDVTTTDPRARGFGFVFQESALFPSLDLLDNVTFALRVRGISRGEREKLAMPWLEKVGMASRLDTSIAVLSGGEAQRVAFLRAIIWKPRVLLLDEPFSALDRENRRILQSELIELHRLWPVPLLIASHDEEDAAYLATSRLVFEGTRLRRP